MPAPRTRTETIDCDCTPPRRHGTYHTYNQHLCGCDPCKVAERRLRKSSRRMVPAEVVRKHLLALRDAGIDTKSLARTLGYHEKTLYTIAAGRTTWTRRAIADDIMSYRPADREVA